MNIYPLKNEQDYRRALTGIEGLMDAEFGTEEGDRLDVLVTLVESYEVCHGATSINRKRHGSHDRADKPSL